MGSLILSAQERRLLSAARKAGVAASSHQVEFDWRAAAKEAGIPRDDATLVLKGLRRFGFIGAIGPTQARLTESGVETATQLG
jgi:hypothetical protein